ncbi:MAG: hypothetical protein ACT6FD_00095 [Methanosarcinaceae archaeon]
MSLSKIDSMYVKHTSKRVCQGDILRNIDVIDWNIDDTPGDYKISEASLPYIIVMTQDCDLEWDFNNRSEPAAAKHDKYLPTVLACPAYNAEKFKNGDHLKSNGLKMNKWGGDSYNKILQQNNTRFHYLEQNQALQVPRLVIDFKHYYTIPRDALYMMYVEHYLVTINMLFRESLSQRFSNYLSRIGLPELKEKTDAESAPSVASTSSVASQPPVFDRNQCDEER